MNSNNKKIMIWIVILLCIWFFMPVDFFTAFIITIGIYGSYYFIKIGQLQQAPFPHGLSSVSSTCWV